MKCVSLVAALLGLGGIALADDKPLAELEGSYTATSLTRDGKAEPDTVVSTVSLKIAADEMTFTVKGKMFPSKIKVDPKAKPATIDIAPTDGPEKGRTFPGIYQVEKGGLVLAFTESGDRPADFKGADGVLVVRLKRDAKKE